MKPAFEVNEQAFGDELVHLNDNLINRYEKKKKNINRCDYSFFKVQVPRNALKFLIGIGLMLSCWLFTKIFDAVFRYVTNS